MLKQYNSYRNILLNINMFSQTQQAIANTSGNTPYQALRLLYSSYRVQTRYPPYLNLAIPINRDQTRLRTPNDLVTTIIDSH